MPFIEELSQEHAVIRESLTVLDRIAIISKQMKALNPEPLGAVLDFLRHTILDSHHPREERLLFPALAHIGYPRDGGPKNSYFMGLRLRNLFTKKASGLAESEPYLIAPPTTTASTSVEIPGPLATVAQDHMAIFFCLEMMARELHQWNTGFATAVTLERFCRAEKLFTDLLRLHIQEEDECVFIIASEVLPATIQTELLNQARDLGAPVLQMSEAMAALRDQYL